jgi:menaquinone-dependent protoporphyrinogen oxidase
MHKQKVLVAYASKHGSTTEIARAIASALNSAGLDAVIFPASEVKDLAPYTAVIIGSAIYMNSWLKDATAFLHRFRKTLSGLPVWLFQAGPLDKSAESSAKPLDKRTTALTDSIGFRGYTTFGGKLTRENPGLAEKLLSRRGMEGDFRNFDQVKSWAENIATEIRNS